jgi:hypothetical protein
VSDKLVERLREKVAQLPQDRHPGCFTVTVGAQDCLALADRIEELERAIKAIYPWLETSPGGWRATQIALAALNPSAAPERQ